MENKSQHIVFITGAFVSHLGWEHWQGYFQSHGFATIAPPWPFKEGSPDMLRNQVDNLKLARLTLGELVNYFAYIVSQYSEKPIVIGHSLGGLVVQILVNRELVSKGVAIHPVPPKGITPYEFSFLKAAWKSLGLFTPLDKPYLMSFKDFQYAFVNGMPLDEQRKAYEEQVIPESKRVSRGGLTDAASVNFKKAHPPLLITSGSNDNIIPAHLNARNYKHYKANGSVLDYKEFPGRNHFVLGQHTWLEDAEYILKWIENN